MSGIKKGTARKAPTKPAAAGGKPQPKAAAGGGKKGGAGGAGKAQACFAECGFKGTLEKLQQHYEQVFSSNDAPHHDALVMKLDPHFSDATHCQICGFEAAHSSLLLQHIFAVATKKATGAQAKHSAEMHGTLFSSFVQELCMMPQVGKEDSVEYLLSLTVPDFDADGDDEDDEDDEENDLYEDDDDEDDGEVDEDELSAFEAFLSAQGLNLDDLEDGDEGGPGGSAKAKMQFLKKMMRQMQGMGDEDEDEDEEDEEEEERPRGKRADKKKQQAGAGGKASAGVPPGTNQPGDLKCGSCEQMRHKELYSSAQLKKHGKRRCKLCVELEANGGVPSAAAAKPASASAAAGSSASAAAQPASSGAPLHTLHRHHAGLRHHLASGEEIHSEPEEFDGDGLPRGGAGEDQDDDEEDDEDEDDDEDDDEDSFDPLAAFFGGRRRRPGQTKQQKNKRPRMGVHVVQERPGQELTRDRRLRLKPSVAHPVRCWQPRAGEAPCSECEWRTASRLVQGWRLVCMRCALSNDWMDDEDAPQSDDDEDEENGGAAGARDARRTDAKRVAHHASTFPSYRAGMAVCPRPVCHSSKLLLVYDEKGDEFVLCVACGEAKQKLRYFDRIEHRLIDALQEPTMHA